MIKKILNWLQPKQKGLPFSQFENFKNKLPLSLHHTIIPQDYVNNKIEEDHYSKIKIFI
jgi:hypothetical protein